MNDMPIIRFVDRWLGPKVAAIIAGVIPLISQYTQFADNGEVPFGQSMLETISQLIGSTGLMAFIPAPIAALLAFYLRRAPSTDVHKDKIVSGTMSASEIRDRAKEKAAIDAERGEYPPIHTRPKAFAEDTTGDYERQEGLKSPHENIRRYYEEADSRKERIDDHVEAYRNMGVPYRPLTKPETNASTYAPGEVTDLPGEDEWRKSDGAEGRGWLYARNKTQGATVRLELDKHMKTVDMIITEKHDDMREQVNSMGEALSTSRTEMHKVNSRVSKFITQTDNKIEITNERLRSLEVSSNKVNSAPMDLHSEKRIDTVESNIEHFDDELGSVNKRISDISSEVSLKIDEVVRDLKRFTDHNNTMNERLVRLELPQAFVKKDLETVAPSIITSPKEWPVDDQSSLEKFFGKMGENQVKVKLPYTMRLAWDLDTELSRFSCHEKVASAINTIFIKTLEEYGEEKIRDLGLDLFAGCLNVRLMRGSDERYSTHSWGIAVDIDSVRNGLRARAPEARLSQEDAIPFWDIVESVGGQSSGRIRGFDFMHFQFAQFKNHVKPVLA